MPRAIGDASPAGVQRRAEELDIDTRLEEVAIHSERYWREHTDEIVQFLVEETKREAGVAPDPATVRAAVGDSPTPSLTADRFLFAWELENGLDERMSADGSHLAWFEPDGQAVAVVLLPDPHPWTAFGYISSLYEACSYGHDLVVALAKRWHDRFGAEPVALWGTMVEWFVDKPPIDPLVAWDLAREQGLIAGNTTDNAGVSIRDHSRALRGRRDWFLHSRP